MLRLSDLLGSDVRTADGRVCGHLVDATIQVGELHPRVHRLAIGRRRHIRQFVPWGVVASFEHDDIALASSIGDRVGTGELDLLDSELLLARDVLDTQIVDVAGKRLARVSEVLLARADDHIRVAGVEIGASGVWRQLGLDRLAERTPERIVDWADLHPTSTRGHALHLAIPGTAVHRLSGEELAFLVSELSTSKGAQVLDAVSPVVAAGALSASHPRLGARLLHAMTNQAASAAVAEMAVDDATSLLRDLRLDSAEELLANVRSERAATLRKLLAHPPDTAGGLMNSDVLSAPAGESVDSIRLRLGAAMPDLVGLATVFVVDADGRPIGSYEPTDLLSDRQQPRQVPRVPMTLPVQRVIDLFALHDYLALPVVDADERLIGVVAVDDVLEELLAERLPGVSGRRAHHVFRSRKVGRQ